MAHLCKRSIILPGNGANVGQVWFFSGKFEAYQRTYVLNNFKCVSKYLYYHLLVNWKKTNEFIQFGSATNYLRMQNFETYTILLPPANEQKKIVSILEACDIEIDLHKQKLELFKKQKKGLMQKLLTGQIRVKV